jgi:hypothetical protein
MVKADLTKNEEGRTYHDNVVLGPSQKVANYKEMNWWVPGPNTAALLIEWIEKNGGKVVMNQGVAIQEPGIDIGKKKK